MPAQKRSHESTPPPSPPEEKDDDPKQPEPSDNNDNDNNSNNNNDEQVDGGEDSDENPASSDGERDEFVMVKLSEIRKEVQCPICLGIIRKTRTVMECLHRFCRECIDKAMRLGNNECPACRTHCASRRSLRDDPNYDALITALYPDIEKYEEEELAFHEEEKARNKQIQESIAQTLQRQSEALGRKRTTARATAAAFMRRSQRNLRNLRGRRNQIAAERLGSADDEDANGHDDSKDSSSDDERITEVKPKRYGRWGTGARSSQPSAAGADDGGKDSSSGEERNTEVKPKRYRRWSGPRSSQPSAAGADAGCDENGSEANRQSLGTTAGLVGNSENFTWGKGRMRSHNRHGSMSGGDGKLARNRRLSKLMDCLRCSDENTDGLDISLVLVPLHEEVIPKLQRPYICCRPTMSVRHICQYIALQTSMQADEIEMLVIKELQSTPPSSSIINETESFKIDPNKDKLEMLKEHQSLAEIQSMCSFNQRNLVLAYRQKLS